jgi:hypothetical protein
VLDLLKSRETLLGTNLVFVVDFRRCRIVLVLLSIAFALGGRFEVEATRDNDCPWSYVICRQVPVGGTLAMPAALKIDQYFQVTHPTPFSGLDIVVHGIDCVAKSSAKVIIRDKVIGEIIENPMPERGKGANADNPAIVLKSVDGPLQPSEQKREKVTGGEVGAKGEEKVRHELIIHEGLGRYLCYKTCWSGRADVLGP